MGQATAEGGAGYGAVDNDAMANMSDTERTEYVTCLQEETRNGQALAIGCHAQWPDRFGAITDGDKAAMAYLGGAEAANNVYAMSNMPGPQQRQYGTVNSDVVPDGFATPIIGNKLNYIFGQATGSEHNIQRSVDMQKQLMRIGVQDTPESRAYLVSVLNDAYSTQTGVLQTNGRVMRTSLISGRNGFLQLDSVWEGNRLITVNLIGKPASFFKVIMK